MRRRKFGIMDYIVWGLLATSAILLIFSVSVSDAPGDTGKAASRTQRMVTRRMTVLEGYMASALASGKEDWIGHLDLPKDMVIYRYIHDTLQSWCNQFPVRNDDISSRIIFQSISRPRESISSPLAEITEKASFVNYGQKWYLVKAKSLGPRKVIAGLEIIDSMDEDNPGGINRKLKPERNCSIIPLSECGGSVVSLNGSPIFKISANSIGGTPLDSHSSLFWFAISLFIIAALMHLRSKRTLKRLLYVVVAIFAVMVGAYFRKEHIKDNSKLFSPTIYADGQFFNSLGTVLIVSSLIFLVVCCLFVTRYDIYRRLLKSRTPRTVMHAYSFAIVTLMAGIGIYVHAVFRSIIQNSNISLELYQLNDLSVYSLIVYLNISALLMTLPLLTQMLMPAMKKLWGTTHQIFSASSRTVTAIIFSAYMVITAGLLGFKKEQNKVNVWANRLSMERDISLELELRHQEDKLASDQTIAYLSAIDNSNYLIMNRIVENYLFRLSQDYDFTVELFSENMKDQNALTYFTRMVSSGAPIFDESRFRYMRDSGGHNLYIGSFAYYTAGKGVTMMLLTVAPKSNREDRGYARVLGYTAPGEMTIPSQYSYAKYASGKLTSFKGTYAFPTVLDEELKKEIFSSPDRIFRLNDMTNFVNAVSDEDLIIISRPRKEGMDYLVAFLFLTLFFYMCLSILALMRNQGRTKENNYYKSRINAVMMMALIMTLIALAAASVLFVYKRNNANLLSSMANKANSLQILLEARCRFAQDYTALNTQEAASILEDVSNTMKSDITLYTTVGKEFRTTTPEVFEKMLLGSRMNQDAFENIIYRNRRYYIGREEIGSKMIYFLYAPLFNAQGKMIAIMSSPFTDESFEFKYEAVLHSITIITVFMILLLLARFITAKVVDKMFKPLSEIGSKMNAASINNLEYIVYERDDEVSSLVRAYNLMVHDLYDSTKQLTQTERDKAWATMARQVAHEIKNPLTPIKLQIQRLIRMKNNGNPLWADRFDEISEEVLKQIDLLADTANEFSTFAKLYTEEPVEIDLDKLLKAEIELFDSRDNISFSYMGLDKAKVVGPKPQLTRVIANLINNSVQAIENEQIEAKEDGRGPFMGRILVSLRLSIKEGFYDIVFEDNGPGVSDENRSKLFTPNFTTKSNGTGLGLSICRNIIEKCNGEILYSKSFALKGACFTVRFPRKS